MRGKLVKVRYFTLTALAILTTITGGCMQADGFLAKAPLKKFVVIDKLPEADPQCVTIRERKETLAHLARRLGWATPGGIQGDGYYEVIKRPPWPCELQQEWLRSSHPPEGAALEVWSEDAISAIVTGFAGEKRRIMLRHHSKSQDLDPNLRNDEMPLLGYHYAWIPWDATTNSPACLARLNIMNRIQWPPEGAGYIYLLFGVILGLKVLDCIGKGSYAWLWSLVLYAVLFAPILHAVSVSADSRTQCEPRAAIAFADDVVSNGVIYPFTAAPLESGPWIADSSIVLESQLAFFLIIILALRLCWPAYIGLHYLLVPHPVERVLKESSSAYPSDLRAQRIADALGEDVDFKNPAPAFKSRNQRRRLEELAKRLQAEADFGRREVRTHFGTEDQR